MADVEKGRGADKGGKPVREFVPGHRPPPAAGCFGKLCPTEAPKRGRTAAAAAPSIEEFETRFAWTTKPAGRRGGRNHIA